jgi:hypothetical protein
VGLRIKAKDLEVKKKGLKEKFKETFSREK